MAIRVLECEKGRDCEDEEEWKNRQLGAFFPWEKDVSIVSLEVYLVSSPAEREIGADARLLARMEEQ